MAIVANIVPYSASKNNGGLEFERQIDYSCKVTEVLYGIENAVGRGEQFMKNAREKMDLFGDKNGQSRGTIRLNTGIMQDNLQYCKELGAGVVDNLMAQEAVGVSQNLNKERSTH
jgi:hypothetical protein